MPVELAKRAKVVEQLEKGLSSLFGWEDAVRMKKNICNAVEY